MIRRKVLLTGSAGFVGREFIRQLSPLCDITPVDTVDGRNLLDFVRENPDTKFDLVVHCAAIVGGRASIDSTPFRVASNLRLDYTFVEWAKRAMPSNVILFSSSAAYPVSLQTEQNHRRLKETDINLYDTQQPDSSYGWAKLTLERLDKWSELNALILRPFSGYSHEQSPEYPFRAILERVKRHEDPIEIWSDTTRDFIHISDVVAGAIHLSEEGVTGPMNLCTGRATSFSDLVRMMAYQAGYTPAVRVRQNAPTGVAWRVGDPQALLQLYTPQVSLEEGIRKGLR